MFVATSAGACTTFCMTSDGRVLFGANYDWDAGVGMVMINKRDVAKQSFTLRPVHWTSRFASITVNQFGREFPTGGMNEAGLVVALMALGETQYPAVDDRQSVTILEWIQFQLDNSADVADVLDRSPRIRIAGQMGLHYLVADRSGRAVTVEYLNGELVTHTGDSLPMAVLANDSYDRSLQYLRTISGFGGTHSVPNGIGSLERFARAASMIRQSNRSGDPVGRAFAILDSVHQPDFTKWSVVYDPGTATMYFRTYRNPDIRSVSIAAFDLQCSAAVRTLDINRDGAGDMTPFFVDYDPAANRELIDIAYATSPMLAGSTEEDRRETAEHSENGVCVREKGRAVRRR